MMPVDRQPACSEAAALPLIDAVFGLRKGYVTAARTLTVTYCRRCPVARECLAEGMAGREPGLWGGTHRNNAGQVRVAS